MKTRAPRKSAPAYASPTDANGYLQYFEQSKNEIVETIQRLVEIVSKGGNYLLNIGPMGDGAIPEPSVRTLEKVGAWMRRNGDSI